MKIRDKKFLVSKRLSALKTLVFSKTLRKETLQTAVSLLYTKAQRLKQPTPSVQLENLLKKEITCSISPNPLKDGNLSYDELIAITALIQACNPKHLLEIGTFNGLTTLHMAMNTSKEAKIHTLDLSILEGYPKEALDLEDIKYIEANLKKVKSYEKTAYHEKIIEHEGNSLSYPFSNFTQDHGKLDFIFIDGGHSYQVVRNDTEKSLGILQGDGVLIWHDYTPTCPGVFSYLNELSQRLPILHLDKTTLAYLRLSFDGNENH